MRNQRGITKIEIVLLVVILITGAFSIRGCIKLQNQIKKDGVKSILKPLWEGQAK